MSANGQPVADDHTDEATSSAQNMKVQGDALAARVKDLLHEGNVRRISVKNDAGDTIIEIPVTVGVIAAVVAPVLSAVAAIAALASSWEIEVHRSHEKAPLS